MLVIGSQALALCGKGNLSARATASGRKADLDLIATFKEMMEFCVRYGLNPFQVNDHVYATKSDLDFGYIEFEIADNSESCQRYIEYVRGIKLNDMEYMQIFSMDTLVPVAPLEVLFSIKRSHRHYPRAWQKHIADYLAMKQVIGQDKLPEITKIREKETEIRYGKLKTPSLDKKTEEFFDDNVSNQVFIHDHIHEVMAHREKPMFEYIKIDPNKVTCSKHKFNELSFDDRMLCVLEEAYVIALERGIIPMMYQGKRLATAESALRWSLMRICTTLTSGWFRDFATENYLDIWNKHDRNYVQKFLQAVEQGKIKRIQEAVTA